MSNPSHLIWLDLETTGLNPTMDRVLEICAYIADFSTPFQASLLYKEVLRCRSQDNLDQVVLEMHAKSGLWSECIVSSKTASEVDRALIEAIVALPEPPLRQHCVMAGFSVHFDLSFVKVNFPAFSNYFVHRVYDVSAVKTFCRSLGMPEATAPKQEAHRAEADVLESIAHGRICAEWLRTEWR